MTDFLENSKSHWQIQTYEAIAFVGDALSPLYLNNPKSKEVAAQLEAWKSLDIESAAQEWPFTTKEDAENALNLIVSGLSQGINDVLVDEYRRVIAGPGKRQAPPYGSVYTDWENAVFGETCLGFRHWMRENGIEKQQSADEPEDHFGLMLAMMAWIARHQPENLHEYLQQHFLTWATHYLELAETDTNHSFYQGLFMLTRCTLEGIQAELNLEIEYPKFFK